MDYSKLIIKDEAFTKEKFQLEKDKNGVLSTIPKPKDLSKYYNFGGYISHQSDKKTLLHWFYNLVKIGMFRTKYNLIRRNKNNIETVLDFGCGTGEFVSYLKSKQIHAEGLEPTRLASEKAEEKDLIVYETIGEIEKTFDVITLFHVLEHVEDYEKTIQKLVEKLNKNGLLIIAVPNYKSYDANYYKEKWAAWDVPRHLWHFKKSDIIQLGNRNSLELIQIRPMPFDAFYISMVSESYKGNSKLKGIWRGLISNLKAIHTKEYSSNLFLFQKQA